MMASSVPARPPRRSASRELSPSEDHLENVFERLEEGIPSANSKLIGSHDNADRQTNPQQRNNNNHESC